MADSKLSTVKVTDAEANQAKLAIPFAQEMAVADKTFDGIIEVTAKAVAKVLGVKPTYGLWTQVSYEFQKAYMEKRDCKSETAANRWFAVCSFMEKTFELKKPQAPTVAADKKAKERAAMEKKVKAAKAQCVKPAEAIQKAEELMKAGKVNEAKVYQAAAAVLSKEALDNAKQQASEVVKKAKEALRTELAKCEDVALLQQALAVLKGGKEPAPAKAKVPTKVKGAKEEVKA